MILIFSADTNCESVAYRSFGSEEYSARGVRKVTKGITFDEWKLSLLLNCRSPSLVHRDYWLVAAKLITATCGETGDADQIMRARVDGSGASLMNSV